MTDERAKHVSLPTLGMILTTLGKDDCDGEAIARNASDSECAVFLLAAIADELITARERSQCISNGRHEAIRRAKEWKANGKCDT